MNNQKTVPINLASIFHRRKIISLFFFSRCVLWLSYYSSLLGCHLPYTSWSFPSRKQVHFPPYSTLCQQCLPKPPLATIPSFTPLSTKDSGLPSKGQFFARRTWMIWTVYPCEGCDESKYNSEQEHAKAYFVSHCWTHAQWWICLLLSIPFHFVSMKRKPIWVSKPHYCIQCYIFGGTASLISFVLPFSDNHFSNKKKYCSHSQIFRGFLHFLEIYSEIPNMFNVNFMKWRYIMRYLFITVERFTGVGSDAISVDLYGPHENSQSVSVARISLRGNINTSFQNKSLYVTSIHVQSLFLWSLSLILFHICY